MGTFFAYPDFPELQLSSQPAERSAQVRVLDDVLSVVERRHLVARMGNWSALARFAETPAVVEATAVHLGNVPVDADFGSFEELSSHRDITGVVRLRER